MEALLTGLGSFVTGLISQVGSWASAIVGNDVLCIFCIYIPLAGLALGFVLKLIGRKKKKGK